MQDMLFLSQRLPFPPNKGDKIRSFNILKYFSQTHRIHLGCFIDDPVDWDHVPELRKYCADTFIVPLNKTMAKLRTLKAFVSGDPLNLPYYYNRALADWTHSVLTRIKPRVAFAFSSQMAQYLLQPETRPARIVVDYCDVDSDKWDQYAKTKSWPMSWIYRRESRTLLDFDRRVCQAIDAGTFVAEPEVALFKRIAPETAGKIYSIGNGIDTAYFSPDHEFPSPFDPGGPVLIFTGAMDYWPNIDAVRWFANDIFPRVREAVEGVRFFIVGASPTEEVYRLGTREGVFVTGRVPDTRPYFAHARVAVTPMRIARGIQNKVLEAMAMRKPTVTTPTSLAGIEAVPERDILVGESADEFAALTIRALNEADSGTLGANARAFVRRECSWPTRLAAYDALIA